MLNSIRMVLLNSPFKSLRCLYFRKHRVPTDVLCTIVARRISYQSYGVSRQRVWNFVSIFVLSLLTLSRSFFPPVTLDVGVISLSKNYVLLGEVKWNLSHSEANVFSYLAIGWNIIVHISVLEIVLLKSKIWCLEFWFFHHY